MNTRSLPRFLSRLVLPGVLASAPQLLAESVTQPTPFSSSNEGALYNGTGNEELASPGFFTATVEPFDDLLGTLLSFTIHCEIDGELMGTVGDSLPSGTTSGSLGGTFSIGGSAFGGTGGANGGGGASGDPLQVMFGIPAYEQTLLASDAGVSYDPAILAMVTGEEAYEVAYSSSVTVNFDNMADLLASVAGTIVMTYTYEPVTGGTATLEMVGILRSPGSGQVTIEWTSAPEKTYVVEAGEAVEESDFEVIAPAVPGNAGDTTTFTDADSPATSRRFYRVREAAGE